MPLDAKERERVPCGDYLEIKCTQSPIGLTPFGVCCCLTPARKMVNGEYPNIPLHAVLPDKLRNKPAAPAVSGSPVYGI